MSRTAPDSEELVAVVTGVGAKKVFHRLEDGEPVCGPGRRSSGTRRVERAVLGSTYRRCLTCYDQRDAGGGAGRAGCPFCGEEDAHLVDHLPECERAEDYFEEEIAR